MKHNIFFKALVLALLVAGSGICNRAHAQYQSFFGDSITEYSVGGRYVTKDYDPYFFYVKSYPIGLTKSDTISFNHQTYYFFENYYYWGWQHSDVNLYIREDTVTGRIYRYDALYDREVLICDMSLGIGDTFYMPYSMMYWGDETAYRIPIIADSVWFENGRKNIRFTNVFATAPQFLMDDPMPIVFIEGIGPNFTPFGWIDGDPDCNGGYDVYPFLLCVHKDGELVYMADERAGCYQLPAHGEIVESEQNVFKSHPNPAHDRLFVSLEEPATGSELFLSDMGGRIVYRQTITENDFQINVSDFVPGNYVLSCVINNKVYSQKIVKTK